MKALSNILRGSFQNHIATRAIASFSTTKSLSKYLNNDIDKPLFKTYSDMSSVDNAFAISSRTFSTKMDTRFCSYDSATGAKKPIDVTNDYVFKNIFKHKEIIKNFLENVNDAPRSRATRYLPKKLQLFLLKCFVGRLT